MVKEEKKNIALVGFMATGKTTIAKKLARSLGMEFIDIDRAIEEKMGMKISYIFEKHGEDYFRQIEKNIVEETSKLENMVISCGGGVCLDSENIVNLKKKGKVVLLEADVETVLQRVSLNNNRPLLKDKKDVESIKDIMDRRKDSYHRAADIIVDTSKKSISQVRDEILRELNL